jgi:hypothetical protein
MNRQMNQGVFTFYKGRLLPPELVSVWNEDRHEVVFRGKVIRYDASASAARSSPFIA